VNKSLFDKDFFVLKISLVLLYTNN